VKILINVPSTLVGIPQTTKELDVGETPTPEAVVEAMAREGCSWTYVQSVLRHLSPIFEDLYGEPDGQA
jgi:hypothetical protein